jgi:acyl transferase domain-containing protein
MHHNYRIIVSGSDLASILLALKSRGTENHAALASLKPIPSAIKKKTRVVFMFSGQGTLHAELGSRSSLLMQRFAQVFSGQPARRDPGLSGLPRSR